MTAIRRMWCRTAKISKMVSPLDDDRTLLAIWPRTEERAEKRRAAMR